jgi:uncharacterized protein involved in exopolysaccharide biosynthesis
MQNLISDLDEKSITQQDLRREVKTNEENYVLYLSKREQERTSDALDKSRIGNVTIAVPPGIPALPSHSYVTDILIAFCLAILSSISLVYLADYLDSSFHSPAEIEAVLNIPIVVGSRHRVA